MTEKSAAAEVDNKTLGLAGVADGVSGKSVVAERGGEGGERERGGGER